jgi:hypothetical protein
LKDKTYKHISIYTKKIKKKEDIEDKNEINDKYINKSNLRIYNCKEIIVNKVSCDNDDSDWIIVKNQNI